LSAGAAWVEVDISALADGDYLLVHDALLDQETTGSGPVEACTAAQSATLRFRQGGRPTAVPVPRLGEVVALVGQHAGPTRLQLDFKSRQPFPTDEPLARLLALIEPLGARVLVSSVADWQLRRLRELAPWLTLGFDPQLYLDWRDPRRPPKPEGHPRRLGAHGLWDDHPLASPGAAARWPAARYLADRCATLATLVPGTSAFYVRHQVLAHSLDLGFDWAAALRERGIVLDAWTLDAGNAAAEATARRLRDAGVDRFTTNTPGALARLLGGAA
jgi:glycerophosphoryl diester phosphodiesterase